VVKKRLVFLLSTDVEHCVLGCVVLRTDLRHALHGSGSAKIASGFAD